MFDANPVFAGACLQFAVPEHKVALAERGGASQCDVWGILSTPDGVVSLGVEAKAGETFDKLVSDWLKEDPRQSESAPARNPTGRQKRLKYLCDLLGIQEADAKACRYQLLHRPLAAVLEARRFGAQRAVFMVQAFGNNDASFDDYCRWCSLLGIESRIGVLQRIGVRHGVDLWSGWVSCPTATDQMLLEAGVVFKAPDKRKPHRGLIESIVDSKKGSWSASTERTARIDAQCILESLLAEYGVDAAFDALRKQGFAAESMGYVLRPMSDMAAQRRSGL